MNVEIGRQNIKCNSVLEIMWPPLEIHKSELDNYIGFSLALRLQCR
jgi:hypothetical protein